MTKKEITVNSYVKQTGKAVDAHQRKVENKKKAIFFQPKPSPWDMSDLDLSGSDYTPEKGEGWIMSNENKKIWIGPGADLERRDLSGLDLSKANLHEANLKQAKLNRTELMGANLVGVNATEASFKEASLRYVTLDKANLFGADMTNAVIRNASITNAEARRIKISDGILENVDFTNTNFENVYWRNTNLLKVDFTDASLDSCKFEGCRIQAILMPGHAHKMWIINSNISGSDLSQTVWSKCLFSGVKAHDTNFSEACFNGGTTFEQVNFKGSILENTKFNEVKFRASFLEGIHWVGAQIAPDTKILSTSYDNVSFDQAIEKLGITQNQFEFLVISNGLEVRDTEGSIVTTDFNPQKHHIPQWAIDNFSPQ